MTEVVPFKKVMFQIHQEDSHVEFMGEGLSDDELETVINVFANAVGVSSTEEQPEQSIMDHLKGFFPPEVRAAEEDHPENANYLDTGIKYKKTANGWVPTYRARYTCTNRTCNNQGNRYVEKAATTTKCHNCGEKLNLRKSTDDGFPSKDAYGNFFLAGEEKQ